MLVLAVVLTALGILVLTSRRPGSLPVVHVFHAAGLAPFLDKIRDGCEQDGHQVLQTEASGSQEACRKISELGRVCDVLVLADNQLVTELLTGVCRWRIDFATDEMVLGVGARAPHVTEAELDWTKVVLRDDVRLARVDENLGPLGYRTLLTLTLQEYLGTADLCDHFRERCSRTVDDVERLVPLLKSGEVDYAFLYRSTGLAHGVRFIELNEYINLGSPDQAYGRAKVRFDKLKSGESTPVMVRGAPIVWCLTQPQSSENREPGFAFIQHFLTAEPGALEAVGFRPLHRPRFYGPREVYRRFATVAEYAGELQ